MPGDAQYPKLVIGSFIMNQAGEILLRTTPSQGNDFTCINAKVGWGETIESTIRTSVREKTNLDVASYELLGLTDGLNITVPDTPEPIHMVFADYLVRPVDDADFRAVQSEREYRWLKPEAWLALDRVAFGSYIYEIIERIYEKKNEQK